MVLDKFSQTITKNNEFENRKLHAVLSGKHVEEEIRTFLSTDQMSKGAARGKKSALITKLIKYTL